MVAPEPDGIRPGEEGSWQLGNGGPRPGIDFDTTAAGSPKNPGSQVFAGFQPANAVDRFRNSLSVYAELESDVTEQLLLSAAGRFETYSDFGETVNGKLAGRFKITDKIAIRAAASTGFRAPSLHQLWFNNVSIQFVIDPALPEKYKSVTLSYTFFDVTADKYRNN